MFTQPVGQSGVPSQNAEHILGEVFLDSLAVPAGPLPDLNLNLNFSGSSSCLGGLAGRTKTSGLNSSGGSASLGGSTSSGSLSPSASGFDSGSSATGGGGVPTSLAALSSLLRSKPMWLLLAYLVWQTLAVVTGVSLWNWRRGGATCVGSTIGRAVSEAAGRLRTRPRERHDEYAFCAEDGYWFRPAYTGGKCPLCAAVAPGGAPPAPLLVRMDRSWLGVALFALVSLAMSALVLFTYFSA